MKKFGIFLVMILTLALCLSACSTPASNSSSAASSPASSSQAASVESSAAESEPPMDEPDDGASVTDGSRLVMATESGFAPYEYLSGEEVVGVDVDIANEIAKELGKTLEIVDMPFDAIIASVQSGKADFGAAGMSVTEERKKSIDFTIEYAESRQVIVVKEGSEIASGEDLAGKTVGVQLGTTADFSLADYAPDATAQQYNKYFEAAGDLTNGRIDCIVMDNLPANELVKSTPGLVILPGELYVDKYAFCVSKDNPELLTAINTVMERLVAEGKVAEFIINHSK